MIASPSKVISPCHDIAIVGKRLVRPSDGPVVLQSRVLRSSWRLATPLAPNLLVPRPAKTNGVCERSSSARRLVRSSRAASGSLGPIHRTDPATNRLPPPRPSRSSAHARFAAPCGRIGIPERSAQTPASMRIATRPASTGSGPLQMRYLIKPPSLGSRAHVDSLK